MAMQLFSTVTVGSAVSLIEFANVPQTGKDLLLLVSARDSFTGDGLTFSMQLNFSGGNGCQFINYGTSVDTFTTGSLNNFLTVGSDKTASVFSTTSIYIADYTSSSAKLISSESADENVGTARSILGSGKSTSTSAVTNVRLFAFDTFVQHSTASLYIIS